MVTTQSCADWPLQRAVLFHCSRHWGSFNAVHLLCVCLKTSQIIGVLSIKKSGIFSFVKTSLLSPLVTCCCLLSHAAAAYLLSPFSSSRVTLSCCFDNDLNLFVQFKVKAVWSEMEMHGLRQLIMKYRVLLLHRLWSHCKSVVGFDVSSGMWNEFSGF